MDPILVANLKVSRTASGAEWPEKVLRTASGEAGRRGERRMFARSELCKQRMQRGQLLFLDRMEVDATSRRAFSEVCTLRQNRQHRDFLDRAVDRLRPVPLEPGPRVVTHSSKILSEEQKRHLQWAPLECY
mmetsp:Transcript_60880/g.162986  ORF Transcript_60880/g.162986 Transcript_60880/m.162986 type:complete len:131 (-) Transcript_60880:242-634(-)